MKSERPYLHSLPVMTIFRYRRKIYRTIIPLTITYVNSCHRGMKREVMDLKTFKTVRLPFFTSVTVVSEKFEKCEK